MRRRALLSAAGMAALGLASAGTAPVTALAATRSGWVRTPLHRPDTFLNAVSAHGADWAVGQQLLDGFADTLPLIMHRAGTRWHAARQPVSANASLVSVAAVSRTEAWAVGSIAGDGAETSPLVLRWDGTAWRTVHPPVAIGALATVAVGPDGSIWVAGWGRIGTSEHGVVYRYRDGSWQAVGTGLENCINGNTLLVRSADDVWLGANPGLAHFDGTTWTFSPDVPTDGSQILTSLVAHRGELWGVGVSYPGNAELRPLALRCDGRHWSAITTPDTSAQLYGITVVDGQVVVCGERFVDQGDQTLNLPYVVQQQGRRLVTAKAPALPDGAATGVLTGVAAAGRRLWAVGAADLAAYAAYEPR